MQQHIKMDTSTLKLCTSCFYCKKKKKDIYCKLGVWKEIDNGKSILYTAYDFDCVEWDEA